MKIALTGATGIAGQAIVRALVATGHRVDPLPGFRLGDAPDLSGHDALIHAAFAHAPGRYRGGEGDDPDGFRAANETGSIRLFQAAEKAGLPRVIFLSSRAVFDGHPPGTRLTDDLPPAPTTLYGEVKVRAEAALAGLGISGVSLRPTGLYGPGKAQKWGGLFQDYLSGRPIAPRVATELHVDDLAAAVLLCVQGKPPAPALNASDVVLDRRDLLAEVAALTGCRHPLPAPADPTALRIPDSAGLRGMGWRPGGMLRLRADLPLMLDQAGLL